MSAPAARVPFDPARAGPNSPENCAAIGAGLAAIDAHPTLDPHDDSTLSDLRAAALEWHGGQTTAFYAFGSSGTVDYGLTSEVNAAMDTLEECGGDSQAVEEDAATLMTFKVFATAAEDALPPADA